jgi:hypothetical protein
MRRSIGLYFQYLDYMDRTAFYTNDRFSEPPIDISDPTEKSQFSNIVGKGIADFLSKRIDNSMLTVNYEAALRLLRQPISGSRPDLLAFSSSSRFALEAKGYSRRSVQMNKHKAQAGSGSIPVHYSVACVSYNMYRSIRCNYHDPRISDVRYDSALLRLLSKAYYYSFREYANIESANYPIPVMDNHQVGFRRFALSEYLRLDRSQSEILSMLSNRMFGYKNIYLLLPATLDELSENGLREGDTAFVMSDMNDNVYIDSDRIGLMVD